MKDILGLYEELGSIIKGASVGNSREPVWDGTVIGKPNQHVLVEIGLAEESHGYYFPTKKGIEIYRMFQNEK